MEQPTEYTNDRVDPPLDPAVLAGKLPGAVAPIRCEAVTKRYGRVVALDGVDFVAHGGDVHCIAGPNGSGKTTLGRLAAGLSRPTAGSIQTPAAAVGLGFQEPRIYPRLSARENLAVFAEVAGVSADERWIRELAAALRLDRVAHQPAGELSGGFKRKLDLALTVVDTPAYLWLDEPLADLDETSRRRVVGLIGAYAAAGGGVIVSTHDLAAFQRVATHLSVLLDGRLLGTVDASEAEPGLQRLAADLLDEASER